MDLNVPTSVEGSRTLTKIFRILALMCRMTAHRLEKKPLLDNMLQQLFSVRSNYVTETRKANIVYFLIKSQLWLSSYKGGTWGKICDLDCHTEKTSILFLSIYYCTWSMRLTNAAKHTITLTPINLWRQFLDSGGKPECLEKTHKYSGRTRKLNIERSQLGLEL